MKKEDYINKMDNLANGNHNLWELAKEAENDPDIKDEEYIEIYRKANYQFYMTDKKEIESEELKPEVPVIQLDNDLEL